MPISFKLTKKQVEILELAKRLDSFKQLSSNKKENTEIKESFLQDLTKIYSLSKYKSNLRLENIFFKFDSPDTNVPPEYVPRETDEIPRFRNPRAIPKQTFISFRDNCGDDEYMLFGFHKNNFYLGYVRKDCVDGNCPIRFFTGEDSNPNNHEIDLNQKKGILHTKDEFDNVGGSCCPPQF